MENNNTFYKKINYFILRISVIGLGILFVYFNFFVNEFPDIVNTMNIMFYGFIILFLYSLLIGFKK